MLAYGGTTAGITCDRPCPGEPCRCRHRSSAGSRSPSAASRSSSLPAPSSMTAMPAVACGTKTCSRPSPPASPANRDYQAGFTAAMMLKDLALAQEAANAAKEGGFMGFHAERVSEGEQRMLDSLRDTLSEG